MAAALFFRANRSSRRPVAGRRSGASVGLTERRAVGFPHQCGVSSGLGGLHLPRGLPTAVVCLPDIRRYTNAVEVATKPASTAPSRTARAAFSAARCAGGSRAGRALPRTRRRSRRRGPRPDHPQHPGELEWGGEGEAARAVRGAERSKLADLRELERRASAADMELCDLLGEVDVDRERRDQLRVLPGGGANRTR